MRPSPRRMLLAALALLAIALPSAPKPAAALPGFTVIRLAGADRYATAARAATDAFDSAAEAVVASGENFPDALAGNYLAGRRRAPVLLARRDGLPGATLSALQDLGVRRVTLLGGNGALGPEVAAALAGAGITVDRVAGADRFETAAAVARAGGAPASATALLASGRGFADALAAGPIAYGSGIPQLLTEPGSLSPAAASALAALGIRTVVVLGGAGAVGSGIQSQLQAAGLQVLRIAGPDRYATAAAVAGWAVDQLGHRRDHVEFATGGTFPDALAGGAHAGAARSTVLLVDPHQGGMPALQWLVDRSGALTHAHALGGSNAIADGAIAALASAATGVVQAAVCETTLLGLVNVERGANGLPPFALSGGAAAIAESWSAHLAAQQGLSHNGSVGAQLDAAGIRWTAWAENVAYGPSVTEIHQLLMNSPVHRANILAGHLTHVGIGCTVDGAGTVWVTQVFYRL